MVFQSINIRQVPREVLKTADPKNQSINIRQVPREVLKTEAGGRGFQHLPRDLANVNALKNHVRSLLLHKNWKHLLHFALFLALVCFAFSPISRKRNFHGLCSFYGLTSGCLWYGCASQYFETYFIRIPGLWKTDPFHILDSLKCWPIHILPVDFYTHSYRSYSLQINKYNCIILYSGTHWH